MFRFIHSFLLFGLLSFILSACSEATNKPLIISANVIETTEADHPRKHDLGVIGAIEPVYILPLQSALSARIDTGAETSSIDVNHIKPFERDGEKWVSFNVTNPKNNETHHFEKKILREVKIKRQNLSEERYVVLLDIKIGGILLKEQFTLANRDKFEHPVLIGRNILTGRALVDTALSNTLY